MTSILEQALGAERLRASHQLAFFRFAALSLFLVLSLGDGLSFEAVGIFPMRGRNESMACFVPSAVTDNGRT